MDLGIAGRHAAVAAATAGLGYACAQALVAEGVQVTICGSDENRARRAAEKLGHGASWLVADLTLPEEAERFVIDAAERAPIDILVVNGPGPRPGSALATPAGDYQAAVDRSLLAVVRMCLAAAPAMRSAHWGRIVAITSLGALRPYRNLAPANTARAGATGFLRTLAAEIAADGVTVNSVLPGVHATERARAVYGEGEQLAPILAAIPAGRMGQPPELAAAVAFLCSELAGYITGVELLVDGGAGRALT
ncbi:short-chain dehydrogenase [Mycolicibacterium novocastrense]|uniref:SDR family oxidoreductase n=1 Tax=Mycolicibacterium novocastrense TaxID=59813 RepID=UPI000749849D|nr:SDR family oxidoreductase [Mycolicibacterium novocastrense]KUH67481.1 short-chain dehydrogenase [Mycolicibacterium novocastrense]KUH68201.1 short-chain dehydrogenase [Mycolicibacterium novocastrense]KUH74387.1 short-chain dehydrogenase [Mycolicibacterium novocastrense]